MKPAPFRYFAPTTLDEALDLIAEHGDEGKVLAGGQSLIPTMNFRLAQPGVLVDLNNIPELSYIHPTADGRLSIGAMTRQRSVERSREVKQCAPLLHQAMPWIAHVQIRNRGTIGGSLAHADPAAELPAVMLALDAQFRLHSKGGERLVAARDFYIGLFTTELASHELLTEIIVPASHPRTGCSIQEIARRHGDYAMVGVAATVTLDEAGKCSEANIALLSVGEGPVLAKGAMAMLAGERITPELILAAAELAGSSDIEPNGDIHASAEYRRHLAKVLTRRVLVEASETNASI